MSIDAALALHQPTPSRHCPTCRWPYPCPTAVALGVPDVLPDTTPGDTRP